MEHFINQIHHLNTFHKSQRARGDAVDPRIFPEPPRVIVLVVVVIVVAIVVVVAVFVQHVDAVDGENGAHRT